MCLVELICELLPGCLVAVLCCASSTASSKEYAPGMHAMAHCWPVLLRREGCNATPCRQDDACVNAHRDATPLFSAVGYHGMPSCMHLRPGLSELFRRASAQFPRMDAALRPRQQRYGRTHVIHKIAKILSGRLRV